MQFYSPSSIIGLESAGKEPVIKVPSVSENVNENPVDDKPGSQIEPPGKTNEKKQINDNNRNSKEDDPVVDFHIDKENRSDYKIDPIDRSLDKYLNCILIFVVVSSLGCLLFYYKMLRRGSSKIKRHVV